MVDQLKAAGRLPSSFNIPPTTFGIDEFIAGAASQFGSGRMGVEQITDYLDGFSKMTAAILGARFFGRAGALAGESMAGLAQDVFRGLTMPVFQEFANRPVRRDMIENWRAVQESRMYYGGPVQRFSEMYSGPELVRLGFDLKTVAHLDRIADWAKNTTGGSNLAAPLPPITLNRPGGICLGGEQRYEVNPGVNREIDEILRKGRTQKRP